MGGRNDRTVGISIRYRTRSTAYELDSVTHATLHSRLLQEAILAAPVENPPQSGTVRVPTS